MPARSALVPKYCLHKPSGRAYVRIRGKVVSIGKYGTAESKEKYGRLVAELAVQPTTALPPAQGSAITVVEMSAAYLDFAARGKPDADIDPPPLDAALRALSVSRRLRRS